jgi:GDP/UDP-N,N'-diacetylbacillosamine 2-epimerase (hydrolysing)
MKKIAIFTGTRAEYGLLSPLMKAIKNDTDFDLQILVSGMHLSPEFGMTFRQIEKDGFVITEKVEMLLSSDTANGIVKSAGLGMIGFADALDRMKPDFVVILGDRFEAFSVATAAFLMKFPIIHLHGGESTEGATDEALRHAITKMAYLHFTSTEIYRKRVIQLGENPMRVFNVGAIGLDNIQTLKLLTIKELCNSLNFKTEQPYLLVTFHPVTLESISSEKQFVELLQALLKFPDLQVIFTLPNADTDGRKIIEMIQTFVAIDEKKYVAFTRLGQLRYLSAMKHAAAVVGNSSSGIIEAPSFGIPTVNIGDRQKGRAKVDTVIDCENDEKSIILAIKMAISEDFQAKCKTIENIYGDGKTTQRIMKTLKNQGEIELKKSFFDL